LTNSVERPRQRKMDIRFSTWNDRTLYRAGLLETVASKVTKLVLVALQEVRWNCGGNDTAGDCTLFCINGNAHRNLRTGLFVQKEIIITC